MEHTDSRAKHVGALFLHTDRKTDWFCTVELMGFMLTSALL